MLRRALLAATMILAASAAPALADGTLSVSVSGAGNVAGGGINCTRTVAGATSGTCTKTIADVQYCDSEIKPPCHFEVQDVQVTANDPAGFTFDHWTGDCTGTARACTTTMSTDRSVTAVFRDSAPPAVSLSPPASVVRGTLSLAASASDNVAVTKVEFLVRGVIVATDTSAPFSASVDTTALSDGSAAVLARAYDTSGNATASSTSTITIDNTKPSLTVDGPDGATFGAGSTQTWTLSAADATGVAAVTCSVVTQGSPASFGACTGGKTSHTVSGRPAGSYVFTARATDGAGNTTDVSRTFTVDTTAPQTTIAGTPPTHSDGTLSFTFSSSKDNSTFKCRLDAPGAAGTYGPCTSPQSYVGLVAGNYRFHVVATDQYGNADPSDATWDFEVVPAVVATATPTPTPTPTATPEATPTPTPTPVAETPLPAPSPGGTTTPPPPPAPQPRRSPSASRTTSSSRARRRASRRSSSRTSPRARRSRWRSSAPSSASARSSA